MPSALEAYQEQQEANSRQSAGNLQQAAGTISLGQALRQQQQERSFRDELSALGPEPTHEAVTAVASKYANPEKLLAIHQEAANRRDAAKDRAMQYAQNIQLRQDRLDQQREEFTQRTADAAARQKFDEFYKTETLRNREAAGALQAQLRTMGLSIAQQGQQLQIQRLDQQNAQKNQHQVQQLGTALERANLPEADATLRAVQDAITKRPDLAEYLSGPKSLLPDLAVPNDIAAGRQAFAKLFNITLKNRSGAAVTPPEFDRLRNEFGSGAWKTPEQIKNGVEQAKNIISNHYRSVASGFGPEALSAYNDNMRQLGGTPLLEAPEAKKAAPQGGVKFLGFE